MSISQKEKPLLVALVLNDSSLLEDLIDAWEAAGVVGATVLDCAGRWQLKEALHMDDRPLFPSLADLMRGSDTAQKLIFSIVTEGAVVDRVFEATERVVGNLDGQDTGLFFVLPLNCVRGLRRV
jgi:hypothetical protein